MTPPVRSTGVGRGAVPDRDLKAVPYCHQAPAKNERSLVATPTFTLTHGAVAPASTALTRRGEQAAGEQQIAVLMQTGPPLAQVLRVYVGGWCVRKRCVAGHCSARFGRSARSCSSWRVSALLARQRFRSVDVTFVSAPVERPALTRKVALVVLDRVRFDRFVATFPQTHELARARGVVCPSTGGPLTFTVASVYPLGTGAFPPWRSCRRIFRLSRSGRFAAGGPHESGEAHGHDRRTSLDRSLRAPCRARGHASAISALMRRKLLAAHSSGARCRRSAASCACAHDPEIDHRAHLHGLFGEDYVRCALGLDEQIHRESLAGATARPPGSSRGDHGALDSGNHGRD